MTDAFLAMLFAGDDLTNPAVLADFDAGRPEFVKQCHTLARELMARQIPQQFWSADSEMVLTGVIACVCAMANDPKDKTLMNVRKIVCDRVAIAYAFELMKENKAIPAIEELGIWYVSHFGNY